MKEKEDFSKFGKGFQEDLCHLILKDRPFADQMFEVLDINFLELNHLRVFVRKVMEYRKKYGVHPTKKTMMSVVRNGLKAENDSTQVLVRDYYGRILSEDLEVEGSEYIKDTSLDFCKKQKLKEAILKSVSLIKSYSFDEVSKVINDALKLGSSHALGSD